MKKHLIPFTFLCLALASGLWIPFSYANESAAMARVLLKAGDILPLETILQKAKQIKPGQVIEVELEKEDGLYVYELEIVDYSGEVWELELEAKTGELVELENEDD